MKQERTLEQLNGTVEHVIYQNSETGFAVIELETQGELISVVGILSNVQTGEQLCMMGYFTTHAVHGHQFKAETCEHKMPETTTAIFQYLASGVIKGIGKVIAKRIVDHFGEQALLLLEQDPMRLTEIKGITQKKATQYAKEFAQLFGVRRLMLHLAQYGVNSSQSVQIWKQFGGAAKEILEQNPYLLCERELGLPFAMAEHMASELRIEPTNLVRLEAGLRYTLLHNISNGHTCLPEDKLLATTQKLLKIEQQPMALCLEQMLEQKKLIFLQKHKTFVALPVFYEAERYIAARIATMVTTSLSIDSSLMEQAITLLEQQNHITYDKWQKQAMIQAVQHPISILTGGPGTGKTTTLNGLIELLEQQGYSVCIAAPTGRAAKRISEVTGREAKTIHRLLEGIFEHGTIRFGRNPENPLKQDVIIIDEMSMVDTLLLEALLKATRMAVKLVLVGDYNQLPSVGAGNVLHDLLQSNVIPTVRLTQIFRQAEQSLIIRNAHQIVEGQVPDLSQKDSDFFFLARSTTEHVAQTIVELVSARLPVAYGYDPSADIQVLCPQRKGEVGVTALNLLLQKQLNPPKEKEPSVKSFQYTFRTGDKVMQIKNNYDIPWQKDEEHSEGIFNGDIGMIKMIDRGSQTVCIDFDGRISYYSFEMVAEQLELAYAVTVHKSQGSEFEAVVIPIIAGYDRLYYRNLLYTAVTRAKKLLVLVGRADRIAFMVNNHIKSVRFTNLTYLLATAAKTTRFDVKDV